MPGFPETPHAPVAVVQAAGSAITDLSDRRVAVVRASIIQQADDPSYQVRITDGWYKRVDDTLGYWTPYPDPFNRTFNDYEMIMEEVGINPGTVDVYFYMNAVGPDWRPAFYFNWPGLPGGDDPRPYAPLAVVRIDSGVGYQGNNSTVRCPVLSITDARLPI